MSRSTTVLLAFPLILVSLLLNPTSTASGAQAADNAPSVTFVDVADEAGLTHENVWGGVERKTYIIEAKGSGIGFLDYNNDGWLDIFSTNGMRFGEKYSEGEAPTSHLYRNNKNGTFTDVGREAGVARTGWQTGVCVGDFDNDGWEDLFAADWGHNSLFRNKGDGTFQDVTRIAGLRKEQVRWASGCAWLDYDRDGALDLFVANYIELDIDKTAPPGKDPGCVWKGIPVLCGPRGLPGGTNLLYRNLGDGKFEDVSETSGITGPGPAYAITVSSFDFNNDQWPDIYVAVDSRQSLFFENRHDGTFEETGMIAGCAFSENGSEQAGMGVAVADYDRNGWLDIFKTNFQDDTCNLYQNTGNGIFRDVAVRAGLAIHTQYVNWGAGFVDVDNDGWVDIFHVTGHVYPRAESELGIPLKTPRLVYHNRGDGKFTDVSSEMGPGVNQRLASRGCAFGDYDNDGDVDVVVLNMNDRPSLLRCDSKTGNNWITLKLVGTKSNRSAIGTRARVTVDSQVQINEVHSGSSVMSQNDLRLHFGLGKAKRIDLLEIIWPTTGLVEKFTDLKPNQILTIQEGSGILKTR